jgi:hypothetical protein
MPFWPGELLNLRFEGPKTTTSFVFEGQSYTVANGGLTLQRDGGLTVVFRLPHQVGEYPYEWKVGDEVREQGLLRTVDLGNTQRLPARPAEPPPGIQG